LKLQGIFYNILVGVPGGFLIFMGMLMFNAVLNMFIPSVPWIMLIILCFTSLVVGILARLLRPFHGFGSALASGIVAALIILYLQVASTTRAGMDLVLGPVGMLAAIAFSFLGAWIFPRLRKRKL
jgi:hypothetical protein